MWIEDKFAGYWKWSENNKKKRTVIFTPLKQTMLHVHQCREYVGCIEVCLETTDIEEAKAKALLFL